MRCVKPTCCKNVLHKRHGQLGFHFLKLFLKYVKELESFIFCDIKDHIFENRIDIVSVPYLTVLICLAYNLLRILKQYRIVSLILKASSIIVGDLTLDIFWMNLNPLKASLTKWPSTLKQFVGELPTNCLSVFDHFVKLALKGTFFKEFVCR